jgi:hypothetical protein
MLGGSRAGLAQRRMSARAVAVIESIYSDSAGRAIRYGRPLSPTVLDSMCTVLRHTFGATFWFSWRGGPTQPRTAAQDRLLARLRASGVRVELRTDSTMFARVVRP